MQIIAIRGIRVFDEKGVFNMRQVTLALLLALTLMLGLSGCTDRNGSGNDNDILGNDTTQNDSNVDQGTTNGTTNNGTTNSTTPSNGSRSGTDNQYGTNGQYGTNSQYGTNGQYGTNSQYGTDDNSLFQGRSYEDMLRDGYVHDTDGYLDDGENSVSEWN